jgi:hemerythrin superfamily protein
MVTSRKTAPHRPPATTARRRPGEPADGGAPDAVKLLVSDHRAVKALFQEYQEQVDQGGEGDDREAIARQICMMLGVHAQLEEEIFYPAARAAIKDAEKVDEATVEHAAAKDLIAQIESAALSDELFDAKVKVLGEMIDHHVKEEESGMFPQARKSGMDLKRLGEQISRRKAELMAEMDLAAFRQEPEDARA